MKSVVKGDPFWFAWSCNKTLKCSLVGCVCGRRAVEEVLASSDVVLSCGLWGVRADLDWGGVCGGRRSGSTPLLALCRGEGRTEIKTDVH